MSRLLLAHALLMLFAWLVLLPAGALFARYRKVTPAQDWPRERDNLSWWRAHRVLQYAGVACALLGLWLAWRMLGFLDVSTWHVRLGLLVVSLAALQVASTWLRGSRGGPDGPAADPRRPETWRGDHYDMTRRRRAFETWHKPAGWTALLLAPLTILLGLRLAGWPRLVCLIALLLAGFEIGLFARLRLGWRRIGTYQAIWGPDPAHPGNRISRPATRTPGGRSDPR